MFKRKKLPYDKTFLYEGSKISYRIVGSGQPVILLHGSLINFSKSLAFVHILSQKYKVYILDLPGFGASDIIEKKQHTVDLFADVFLTLIHLLKLEEVPIIALSLGGIIAIKASVKGKLENDLILVGLPGKNTDDIMSKITRNVPLFFKRFIVSSQWGRKNIVLPLIIANTGKGSSGSEEILLEELSHTDTKAIVDVNYKKECEEELPQYYKQLKNKRHVLFGEHDRFKTLTTIPLQNYIEIPNAGHNILVDDPEESLRIITRLLR